MTGKDTPVRIPELHSADSAGAFAADLGEVFTAETGRELTRPDWPGGRPRSVNCVQPERRTVRRCGCD